MKYTLLELTQAVLSSMDSDEVTSINDSVESQQVVAIIKTVYDDIISRGGLTSNKTFFNLIASSAIQPIVMAKPANIDRIEWLKYDCVRAGGVDPDWRELRFLPVQDFVDYTQNYNPSETNVDIFTYTGSGFTIKFAYRNDTAPNYYTSFDDVTLVFDAFDGAVDTFLQGTKTLGYGNKATEFTAIDSFVPNLQPQQFALLLSEAKSLAWAELKQTAHPKAEVTARRNWRHLQKTRQTVPDGKFTSRSHPFDSLPNYGRMR